MANRGLKRICASCGIKFYDMDKQPIKCPSCGAEFTGEVAVKSKRSKSSIVPDTVKRDEIEAKNAKDDDEDTVSLEDVTEDDDDDIDDDLDIDSLDDDEDDDDDLSDLDGDIDVDIDKEDDL